MTFCGGGDASLCVDAESNSITIRCRSPKSESDSDGAATFFSGFEHAIGRAPNHKTPLCPISTHTHGDDRVIERMSISNNN